MRINFLINSSIVSIGLLIFYYSASAASQSFSDVSTSHPNYSAIFEMQNRGIISGYQDNTFNPDQEVNRVEALKIILLGAGINVPDASGNSGFTDTQKNAWYSKFIIRAVSLGIIQGFPDKTFKPAQTVNLVETLKILLKANTIDLTGLKVSENIYADAYSDQWYAKYLQYAKNNHLIDSEASTNKIFPNQAITRGELAEIIFRLIKIYRGFMPIQKLRAEEIISIFENGTTEIQYAFVKNLHDGRGVTAGRAGFTTATGDAYEVIKRYVKKNPASSLSEYLAELKALSAERSDDTTNLSGFESGWVEAAKDPLFRSVQDEVVDEFYFYPAMKHADDLGLKFPLSRAVLYDTIIQHGGGNDPDGLPALIERTSIKTNGSPKNGVDEKIWLKAFLQTRIEDLSFSFDEQTRLLWAKSVGRAEVLLDIASKGNYEMKGPIVINTINYRGTVL